MEKRSYHIILGCMGVYRGETGIVKGVVGGRVPLEAYRTIVLTSPHMIRKM